MRISFVAVLCSASVGILTLSSPTLAAAKTAKECQQEWQANKAANEANKITEKAYVSKCRTEASSAEPMSKPAAATGPKETAKEKKVEEKKSEKAAGATGAAKKTAKACEEEWQANKAANRAKGITEKAYVEACRSGTAAVTPASAATKEKTSAPMAPAPAAAVKEKATVPAQASAPATGTPSGANQFAAEAQAKARCGSGTVVWANLESKIYHFAGHDDYGYTKKGTYMCEKDTTGQGMRAAKNEKHP